MELEKVIKYCDDLTPTESRFAEYVLLNKEKIVSCTMQELIRDTFVSKSLIHRFCKKIHLSGFNELKVILEKENFLREKTVKIDVNFPFSAQDSSKVIAEKLLCLYSDTIQDTHDFIDLEDLRKIVLLLHKAHYIDIYTHAHNISIAENFQDKMMSIGRMISCMESFYKQRRQALIVDKTHVAVILSYSGKATFIPKIVQVLKERAIPIVWIGRAGNEEMKLLSDYQLYISDREDFRLRLSQFSSHIAMQYTMDLLFSCIFKLDYEKNIELLYKNINVLDDRSITNE